MSHILYKERVKIDVQIAAVVDWIAAVADEIAAVADEIAAVADEIVVVVDEIADVVDEIAAVADEIVAVSDGIVVVVGGIAAVTVPMVVAAGAVLDNLVAGLIARAVVHDVLAYAADVAAEEN